ncbi:MAG TPA: mechanosensitive ion channel family protein [Clostridiales bacterium]|nr:mechanosensitive ion channel family protein [Clostridiales bacterium]
MELLTIIENWHTDGGILVGIVDAVVIIVVAFLLDRVICGLAKHGMKFSPAKNNNRGLTLYRLVRSVVHYTVAFVALVTILSKFGINVASILAAAGVLGLAVSFGAQSLIKDIFAGFFIILENQYAVDEYITLNQKFTGTVESVGLRVTQLKGGDGELIVVPNGAITDVLNYCRYDMRVKETFEISFDSSIDEAEAVIAAAAKAYYAEHQDLLTAEPSVEGLETIGENGFSICLIAYTQPMSQWAVARSLRKVIVKALFNAGITIPYPVRQIITKVEHHGD